MKKNYNIFLGVFLFLMPLGEIPAQSGAGIRMVAPPAQASSNSGGNWWQKIDATLDIATAMQEMRSRGKLGLSEECDYNAFLQAMQNGAEQLSMIKDLGRNKPKGRWGLPTIDAVTQALHIGEAIMSTKTVLAERRGLIEHVEQVCQTGVQQDEIQRQLELTKMARQGTERSTTPLFGLLGLERARESSQHRGVVDSWNVTYRDVTPEGSLPGDSLWRGADRALLASFQTTREFKDRLEDLDHMLRVASTQMYIAADANGFCPGGGRAPANADTLQFGQGIKRVACAPVSDERATQVMAQMTLLRARAKAIRVASMAHAIQVKTIEAASGGAVGRAGAASTTAGITN